MAGNGERTMVTLSKTQINLKRTPFRCRPDAALGRLLHHYRLTAREAGVIRRS